MSVCQSAVSNKHRGQINNGYKSKAAEMLKIEQCAKILNLNIAKAV